MPSLLRRATAEAIGTFGLVFIGCGAVVADGLPGAGYGLLGVALAHALVLAVLVSAAMNVSGAHFNPAVTVGLLVTKRISAPDAGVYIVTQLAAALLGAFLVQQLFPADLVRVAALGTPLLQHGMSFGGGIVLEAILTFFLMSAIFGTAVARTAPSVGGFAIGLTLLFDILVGGGLTGAAMNPARALGPAVVSGNLLGHAVYWIGPVLGAVVAAVLWSWITREETGA